MRLRRRKSRKQQLIDRARETAEFVPLPHRRSHSRLDVHQDSASLSFVGGLLLGVLVGIIVAVVLTLRDDSRSEPHVRQTGIELLPRSDESGDDPQRTSATG